MLIKKRWLFFGLKICIAAITLVLLVKTVQFDKIVTAFRSPQRPFYFILAASLAIPNLILQCYRWHYLLQCAIPDIRAGETIGSFFGGMVVGFVTPGRIGEMGRSLFIRRGDQLQVLGLVVLDKFYAFVAVLIGGMWGITVLFSHFFKYNAFIMWPLFVMSLIVTGLGVAVSWHPDWIRSFLHHISVTLPVRDKIKRFISCINNFKNRQARVFFLLTMSYYVVYIVQFCLLAQGFQPAGWGFTVIAATATILTKTLLPVSLADLGIREGAAVYFFTRFSFSRAAPFNASLLLFTLNILIPTLIGLFFIPRMGWRNQQNEGMRHR